MRFRSDVGFVALLLVALSPGFALAQLESLLEIGSKVPAISVSELRGILDAHQSAIEKAKTQGDPAPQADFVLVDVRSDAEVNVSIIPGAITKSDFEKHRDRYTGRTVIPYCTIGGRSGRYANQLLQEGAKVKNFKGSILEWVKAEMPVVTLDGKPTRRVHIYSDRYAIPEIYEAVTQ
ncbi:hypothetical protein K227x_60080 [Rubripirellula lacrimiformis]|uniref:Rhodanese domain-containing protein n=1 Tax=Rubripirellula lacrimiformis TaxID=1930273 RepID=A0A517NKC6_9BACT|nr:rhodanese-like domain-containing protein [Rubripirellula lacrimiformis]QDT07580.1 hypothetical protein K227x_60080 [Rubripirellula lacrimiformis]